MVGYVAREDGDLRVVADGESPVMMALTVARKDPKRRKNLKEKKRAGLELMRARKEVGRREQVAACE